MKISILSIFVFVANIKTIVVDGPEERFEILDGMGVGINHVSNIVLKTYPTAPYQRITQTNVSTIQVEYSIINSIWNPNTNLFVIHFII